MEKKIVHAAVAAAIAGLAVGACDRPTAGSDDRTVGQKLDRAVEKTQQKLAEAGEKTKETLKENAPRVEEKLNAAGERIAVASEKVADKTKEVARDAKDTTVSTTRDARAATADATRDARSSDTGRAMSDTAITASIKTDFIKDPDLSVLKIDVDTKDGVVTLNGLAGNDAARQRAEKMAASVKGVKQVRNFLTVKQA